DADLASAVLAVGSVVHDTLGVVRVTTGTPRGAVIAAGKHGAVRGPRVDHVQAPATGLAAAVAAHDIEEPRRGVGHHVVGTEDLVVGGVRGEHHRSTSHLAQAREVEHLHPVGTRPVG